MVKDKKEEVASDFNLPKINTEQLTEHVKSTIEIGGNIAIFGRRGSGKTEISKACIKETNSEEVYCNLSVFERVDMGGYPNIFGAGKEQKFVDFLLPKMYEKMVSGDKPVVALLDEVDKADPSLWAPLLEFTQFRSINGKPLKNLKAVIMTGNLIQEGGARPSLPLLDRAEKYLVEPDAKRWLDWAGSAGKIHPSVVSYIYDHSSELFGNTDPEERYADPSPRGWARASDIIWSGERLGWSEDLINQKVSGCVGKVTGLKYQLYFTHYKKLLPLVDKIVNGEPLNKIIKEYESYNKTEQMVVTVIACSRVSSLFDNLKVNENLPDSINHVGNFMTKVEPELSMITIRSQISLARILKHNLDENPIWGPLLSKLNKRMMSSELKREDKKEKKA